MNENDAVVCKKTVSFETAIVKTFLHSFRLLQWWPLKGGGRESLWSDNNKGIFVE